MHHTLLQDLAIILLIAGIVTVIFRQLRQPVVLGYILAGLIIGPYTPPFPLVQDIGVIETLAELGVIMLMFSLGLHFRLRNLVRVGTTASIAALLEIVVMMGIGYVIGRTFGWSAMNSIFLGAILAISSTTIIIKALEDLGKTKERFAEITFGILVVEDIAAIVILALLSSIAITGTLSVNSLLDTVTNISIFLAVVLVAGLLLVPRLLRYVARFKSDEMLLVALLALCFGVSLLAMKLGYSVALGAFLIGAVVAESREGPHAAHLIEPVRDLFSAVFFVAVGMLIQPQMLIEYALPIAVITVAVIVGKVATCSLGTFLGGADPKNALRSGMSLAQIGEFSFIIAALGQTLEVTSDFLYPIAVSVSAITTLTTPYLIRYADPFGETLTRLAPRPVVEGVRLYARAKPIETVQEGPDQIIRRIVRNSLLQIGVNILLVAGIWVFVSALQNWAAQGLPDMPEWTGGPKTILWCAAMIASLPFLVAIVRKLQGLSRIVAEASIGGQMTENRKQALRSLLSDILQVISYVMVAAILFVVSFPLLPPWPVLVVLLSPLAFIIYKFWGHFVLVYSRAQISLRDTFQAATHVESPRALPNLLRGAVVETIELPPSAPAVGKLIAELEVRSKTGASIVGIERTDDVIVNPNPFEELQAGDRLLVLGNAEQLEAATALLTTESP